MKIKNFTGMGQEGLFYLEGMSAKKINDTSVLTPSWSCATYLSENTSGYSGLGKLNGMDSTDFGDDGSNGLQSYIIGIDTSKIHAFKSTILSGSVGTIHTLAPTGSSTDQISANLFPDIKTTLEDNILYSSANHLGVGFIGTVKTGSGTTKIIDSAGRDFTDLGVSTSLGSNKVYNMNNGEEYTITSITTTTSTNDTLNFDAGTANSEGHIFVVFVDNRFKFTTSLKIGNQFANQISPSSWKRQIELFDEYYWLLNGNYIARLSVDESTWTSDVLVEEHKQLPYLSQATCIKKNQDKLLVGAERKDKGQLLLTDGWSDGWLSVIELEKPPQAIIEYKSGWVVLVADTLYFTNGYSLEKLTTFQGSRPEREYLSVGFNGMLGLGENILLNNTSSAFDSATFRKNGLYIYNLKNRWTFAPHKTNTANTQLSLGGSAGALFLLDTSILVAGSGLTGSTNSYYVNTLSSMGVPKDSSAILYVDLEKKQKVSGVKLKLSPTFLTYRQTGNITVTVNVGEAKTPFWQFAQAKTGSTTTKIVNGLASSGYYGQVGKELRFLSGVTAGERSYIASITNAGESTEYWTISPALSATPTTNSYLSLMDLHITESQTFDATQIPDDLPFMFDGFFSDKLFIEIIIKPAGSQTVDIYDIEIL